VLLFFVLFSWKKVFPYKFGQFSASQLRMNIFNGFDIPSFSFNTGQDKKNKIKTLKNSILVATKNSLNGISMSESNRKAVEEIVNELIPQNSIKQISTDSRLNGTWDLLYTTNSGSSAGKFGPFVGGVKQIVLYDESKYYNVVSFLEGFLTATLEASWRVIDERNWEVIFVDVKFSIGGKNIVEIPFRGTTGIWRMVYLDDNFRILYAKGGKNTIKENLYVLQRSAS